MNAGATAERVYDALKRRLLAGTIAPGEKLEPGAFADELGSSVTPVRDALHRLAGERLVETRTSEGFHLPLVTEPGLRDLYSWNAILARLAIGAARQPTPAHVADQLAVDIERATRQFFRLLGRRSGNVELAAQIEAANDRLGAARAAERRVLTGLEPELRAMAVTLDTGTPAALRTLVAAYHRRRLRAVSAIVDALYRF
ncbi:GntR family transcriptional regulator [Sphingomonas sp. 1P08PE]|uniref:GntR family transcriptional regulator n=1 Tax=Sphingomonas sp. 1P08PE TaxID=554122 RepID=UPI0039A02088